MKLKRPETIQTALRLPVEMHERLKQSEFGVSEDIRLRLMLSFELEEYDQPTRALADAVRWMARQIQNDTGATWHGSAKACETLVVAFQTYLTLSMQPPFKGPSIPDAEFVDDPATLGRAIARHCISGDKAMQKVHNQLRPVVAVLGKLVRDVNEEKKQRAKTPKRKKS